MKDQLLNDAEPVLHQKLSLPAGYQQRHTIAPPKPPPKPAPKPKAKAPAAEPDEAATDTTPE
jgi:hypothetical protein